MALLYEVLESRFDEVLERWIARVRATIIPESMSTPELVDHMPTFLREVIGALRVDAGVPADTPEPGLASERHGSHRLRLGFSLESVVGEYAALRDAAVATALAANITPSLREGERLTGAVMDGVTTAITEYTRQRDAELHRQHNEHVAFLAHELRNPLATAIAAQSVIAGPPSAQSPRALGALSRALAAMQDLVDNALRVAQVRAGVPIELRRERMPLARVLEEAAAGSETEAEAAGIALAWTLDGQAEVEVDRRLIRSALGNLVRNAVKYTHPGGDVEIRGKVLRDRVAIEVEDGCGGLGPGLVESAFSPFVRLTSSRDGFGLGLAIAKQAVDAHGGTIRVENLPGKGCVFVLELPRV